MRTARDLVVEAIAQFGENGGVVLSNLDLTCEEQVKLLNELECLPVLADFDSEGQLHLDLTQVEIALE